MAQEEQPGPNPQRQRSDHNYGDRRGAVHSSYQSASQPGTREKPERLSEKQGPGRGERATVSKAEGASPVGAEAREDLTKSDNKNVIRSATKESQLVSEIITAFGILRGEGRSPNESGRTANLEPMAGERRRGAALSPAPAVDQSGRNGRAKVGIERQRSIRKRLMPGRDTAIGEGWQRRGHRAMKERKSGRVSEEEIKKRKKTAKGESLHTLRKRRVS